MNLNMKNKNIIITGGGGHIGSAISKELLKANAHLNVISRNRNSQEELIDFAIKNDLKENLIVHEENILNHDKIRLLLEDIISKNKKIDGLINNAYDNGIEKRISLNNLDQETIIKDIAKTNASELLISRQVMETMKKNKKGSIIFTGSLFGFLAPYKKMYLDLGNQPSILTSLDKANTIQMTRVMASEWGKFNINVNCISPGFFPKKRGKERPDFIDEINKRVPLQRIGKPEELTGAYMFLLSDLSTYITGQNIIIDGGYSIW